MLRFKSHDVISFVAHLFAKYHRKCTDFKNIRRLLFWSVAHSKLTFWKVIEETALISTHPLQPRIARINKKNLQNFIWTISSRRCQASLWYHSFPKPGSWLDPSRGNPRVPNHFLHRSLVIHEELQNSQLWVIFYHFPEKKKHGTQLYAT